MPMRAKPEPSELWTAARAAANDRTLKGALADSLQERGEDRAARAVRWCLAHDRWPRLTKTSASWYTSKDMPGTPDEVERAILPLFFFVVLKKRKHRDWARDNRGQLSIQVEAGVAYHTLAEAINALGYVLDVVHWWITENTDETQLAAEREQWS